MIQGNPTLNPYATPYLPLSEIYTDKCSDTGEKATEETLDESEKKEVTEKSPTFQVPYFVSEVYDIQNMEKLGVSSESSSKADLSCSYSSNSLDGFYSMDDQNIIVEYISSMYPGVSVDFIAGLLNANNYNVNEAIDLLEHSEDDEIADASETRSHLDPSTQKF